MPDPVPTPPSPPSNDPLLTPQTIIALCGIVIVGGTIIGVFIKGDPPTLQLVVGLVIGTFGSSIFQFYFGSSKGSQAKDSILAQQAGLIVPLAPGASTTSTTTTTAATPALPVIPQPVAPPTV